MVRAIFGTALGWSLVLAMGCGPKSGPTVEAAKSDGQSPTPGTNPPTPPKVEPVPALVWELDPAKHVIPASPVRGRIAGVDVTPEIVLDGLELTFRVLKPGTPKELMEDPAAIERGVTLKLAPMLVEGQPLPKVYGRKWKVTPDTLPNPDVPQVWRIVTGKDLYVYPPKCSLTLELGTLKDGKVPGKIYLCLDDAEKTVLAGTFEATYSRPYTEPPGPDDVPYITGNVTVTGAKSDAEVRVAYAGITAADGKLLIKELQLKCQPEVVLHPDPEPATRPRASFLVSGDGKTRPFRYEHVKLPAGRYVISAAIVGGPVMWKWVDVSANTAITENFTIDATKLGSVEVSVPPDVKGEVFVAPADAPDKPALSESHFHGIAFQIVREQGQILAGKATVKNLAPGKYEVRAVGLRGFVEVTAGKTAELTLTPPKK